jgi:beta-lactam-binding protein with PASTA domain
MVRVPDVLGLSFYDAFARLRARKLRVGIATAFIVAPTIRPLVTSQNPAPGTRIARGRTVTLASRRGMAGGVYFGPDTAVRLPRLTHVQASTAVRRLLDAGLVYWYGEAPALRSSGAKTLLAAYCATDQSPPAGTMFQQSQYGKREDGAIVETITPVLLTLATGRCG